MNKTSAFHIHICAYKWIKNNIKSFLYFDYTVLIPSLFSLLDNKRGVLISTFTVELAKKILKEHFFPIYNTVNLDSCKFLRKKLSSREKLPFTSKYQSFFYMHMYSCSSKMYFIFRNICFYIRSKRKWTFWHFFQKIASAAVFARNLSSKEK